MGARWQAIRRGRGDLPPLVDGLQFFGDLSSPRTSIVSGAVATLGDSSGNALDFTQATSTKRPTYTSSDADFGGRPSMTFDGVDDFLSIASLTPPGTACSAYLVFRPRAVSASDARVFGAQAGATAKAPLFAQMVTTTLRASVQNPTGTTSTRDISGIAANTTYRAVFMFDITNTSPITASYLNGSANGSPGGTITAGASFGTAAMAIGASDSGTLPFPGKVVDCLLYSVAHSAAQVTQIDGWLKWRNGL